ncbi:ornithine cyclodeaminase family protein [Palleronia abyssalis]|uniref:Delta(1)-pyrroline-2-carboxylate reductase n=1 Tax=Palleronia abyssalis TaxID=1501240 RepID=A0A2R8BRP7_9RHOB|nr:ornithine cyclodeaminase [Palleronia abyssalis]SPJ22853.1 Delta(1)-pyrroline-2-carboxylate reductase [Palleronia abyssalis]
MDTQIVTYDQRIALTWNGAIAALRAGHLRPRAQIGDMFLGPAEATLLTRGAWIDGVGFGVKSVTVMPGNSALGVPTVQGAMFVFAAADGHLEAIVDSRLVTEFKTAADSALGAQLLARRDATRLLIAGAGTVARSLIDAYSAAFPNLRSIEVWARRPDQANALAAECAEVQIPVTAVDDLAAAAGQADIISTATMAREPILKGDWIAPGTHVDLIGAFKSDMREADDTLIAMGRLFVDSRETTVHHIGELSIPLSHGTITEADVLADFYDLIADGAVGRTSDDQITVFKNGGGAHLDLMMADYITASVAP